MVHPLPWPTTKTQTPTACRVTNDNWMNANKKIIICSNQNRNHQIKTRTTHARMPFHHTQAILPGTGRISIVSSSQGNKSNEQKFRERSLIQSQCVIFFFSVILTLMFPCMSSYSTTFYLRFIPKSWCFNNYFLVCLHAIVVISISFIWNDFIRAPQNRFFFGFFLSAHTVPLIIQLIFTVISSDALIRNSYHLDVTPRKEQGLSFIVWSLSNFIPTFYSSLL